jgi:hypothetical protein
MNDDLAEKFFDEKVAPGLRARGIEEERLQTVRAQFIKDVVLARVELAGYGRRAPTSPEDLARIRQAAARLFPAAVPGSVRPVPVDDEPDRGEYVDDAGEIMRYVAVEGGQEGVLTVARSGWYRYDSGTASLTQVTDDEADGATAGRYFDDQILPGLLEDGTPADGIAHLRQRYIKDAVADRAAMGQLRELYGPESDAALVRRFFDDTLLGVLQGKNMPEDLIEHLRNGFVTSATVDPAYMDALRVYYAIK